MLTEKNQKIDELLLAHYYAAKKIDKL